MSIPSLALPVYFTVLYVGERKVDPEQVEKNHTYLHCKSEQTLKQSHKIIFCYSLGQSKKCLKSGKGLSFKLLRNISRLCYE